MSSFGRTLGDKGSSLLTELTRRNKRIFTISDAAVIYGGADKGLRKLLFTLVKRKWLQRIEKGKYLMLPFEAGRKGEWTEHEFVIASFLITPYYIGFRSALNYYGYTEQISRTVFIASPRRKLKPVLEVSGVTFRFVCLKANKFFGTTLMTMNGIQVNISDREKTIIDCLDLPEYAGGITEVIKALSFGRKELDFTKLAEYARKNGNKGVCKRLGFLLEKLDIKAVDAINILQESLGSSYAVLDTMANHEGQHLQRWKIIVNVSDDDLLQWKESR